MVTLPWTASCKFFNVARPVSEFACENVTCQDMNSKPVTLIDFYIFVIINCCMRVLTAGQFTAEGPGHKLRHQWQPYELARRGSFECLGFFVLL